MPEKEGFLGLIQTLESAQRSHGSELKDAFIDSALSLARGLAAQSVTSLEMGLELGKELAKAPALPSGIPSMNGQDVNAEKWPQEGQADPENIDSLSYVCDCCRQHVIPRREVLGWPVAGKARRYWDRRFNPLLVEVNGITYYGCTSACARILFDIHHRYAQLEGRKA